MTERGLWSKFEALHRMQDAALVQARAEGPGTYSGDGIVMVAGGGRYFVNAYVSLTVLRRVHHCTLPVQVWHLGPDELSPKMRELLAPLDVEFVDVFDVRKKHPMRRIGGWECKPYAVLHSPFERVMLIDADNVPLQNPEYLFARSELTETGALFWPDVSAAARHSPVWELFRVPFEPGPEFESGQLVIDKRKGWEALHLALHYCSWSDIYWQYINGDKQAFQMAWRFLNLPHELPSTGPNWLSGTIRTPKGPAHYRMAIEQLDFDGKPIFHHRTGCEWVLFGENSRISSGTPVDDICLPILDELRQLWDGRVLEAPPVMPGIDSRDVTGTRRYLYRRLGCEEHVLEFEQNGRLQPGNLKNEQRWRVKTIDGQKTLVISRHDADMCRLVMDDDGIWRGHWLYYEQSPVELLPIGPGPWVPRATPS